MNMTRKTRLSAAMAAVLGGAVMCADVGAVNLSEEGIGEVAIAPYYTTRDGWLTLINLTNTRPVPIVVKVRIHEGQNSRDVLDFNVALSANDVWVAVVKEDAVSGRPVLDIRDTDTCIIGSPNTVKPLNELGFTGSGNEDGGPSGIDDPDAIDRMREGYIEFVVMGYSMPDDGDPLNVTVGESIQMHQCDAVRTAFNGANILATAQEFGEPINALKFNFRLLNPARGMEAGGQAVTWANFFNHHRLSTVVAGPNDQLPDGGAVAFADTRYDPNGTGFFPGTNADCAIDRGAERRGPTDWNPLDALPAYVDPPGDAPDAGSCRNLITAQVDFDFLDPSLNDVFPRVGGFWDDMSNSLYTAYDTQLQGEALVAPNRTNTTPEARGIDVFSSTIQRGTVVNEWALEPALGSDTSWVATFPTKTFYVDKGDGVQFGVWAGGDRHETVYAYGGAAFPPPVPMTDDPGTVTTNEAVSGVNPPYPPFAEAFLPYADNPPTDPATGDGLSCNQVSFTLFDREQNSFLGGGDVIDSPAPSAPTDDLCYEVNVLNFNTTDTPVDGVVNSELDKTVSIATLLGINPDATAGWMELDLTIDPSAQIGLPMDPTLFSNILTGVGRDLAGALEIPPAGNAPPAGWLGLSHSVQGLPVIGFMIKHRDLNDPAKNYVSTIEHAYTRVIDWYVPWNTP